MFSCSQETFPTPLFASIAVVATVSVFSVWKTHAGFSHLSRRLKDVKTEGSHLPIFPRSPYMKPPRHQKKEKKEILMACNL